MKGSKTEEGEDDKGWGTASMHYHKQADKP